MDMYADVVTNLERLEEGYEITALLQNMPTRIEVGSEWYFLPKPWLDKWELYNYADVVTATPG